MFSWKKIGWFGVSIENWKSDLGWNWKNIRDVEVSSSGFVLSY